MSSSVVRTMPEMENQSPSFKFVIKSEYILKACKDVIESWPGISWHTDPLEVYKSELVVFSLSNDNELFSWTPRSS